jgi:hypothetical protein
MRFCALSKVYLEQSTITELISHPIVPRAGPSADNPARRVADPRFSSRLLLLVRDPPPAQTRGNTPRPTREYGAHEPLATATGLVVEAELVGAAGMEETVTFPALSLMADGKTIRGSVYGATDPAVPDQRRDATRTSYSMARPPSGDRTSNLHRRPYL